LLWCSGTPKPVKWADRPPDNTELKTAEADIPTELAGEDKTAARARPPTETRASENMPNGDKVRPR